MTGKMFSVVTPIFPFCIIILFFYSLLFVIIVAHPLFVWCQTTTFVLNKLHAKKTETMLLDIKKRGIFVEKPLEKKVIGNVPAFLLRSPIYIYRLKNSRKSKDLEIHSV